MLTIFLIFFSVSLFISISLPNPNNHMRFPMFCSSCFSIPESSYSLCFSPFSFFFLISPPLPTQSPDLSCIVFNIPWEDFFTDLILISLNLQVFEDFQKLNKFCYFQPLKHHKVSKLGRIVVLSYILLTLPFRKKSRPLDILLPPPCLFPELWLTLKSNAFTNLSESLPTLLISSAFFCRC